MSENKGRGRDRTLQPESSGPGGPAHDETHAEVLRELVAHLRQNRTQLREVWASRIMSARFLTAMTNEEIMAEASSV
jgi:rsbT co-antagonist protein RsbR